MQTITLDPAQSFWQQLPRPIVGLAPMDGVSDASFRQIVATHGNPSLTITEFTAAEGIRAGATRLLEDFRYCEAERPVVAQLFGSDPQAFYPATLAACALGFDGIDINMGCPAKNVTERGAGASLIRDPERAKEIIRTTQRAVADWANGTTLEEGGVHPAVIAAITQTMITEGRSQRRDLLPVSVKTRLGYGEVVIEWWVQQLLETKPATITLHGRTLAQLYRGVADWDAIARAAAIIHQTDTLVLGNGDVQSLAHAHERCQQYGVDGALIGRASFGNPWLFRDYTATAEERQAIALEHARILWAMAPDKRFVRIRKHLLDYCTGWQGAKELREQLMHVQTLADVEQVLC
jgi:tRNA-dihydrouridine synthase B